MFQRKMEHFPQSFPQLGLSLEHLPFDIENDASKSDHGPFIEPKNVFSHK